MSNANQVIINGKTILDIRSDTVTPETLQKGYTAHDKSGTKITGTLEASSVSVQDTKAVTITSNGTVSVTPDAPYDALKKVDVTVDVASGDPNVSYNTVDPNRYSVDLNNRTFKLDLTGLVAGSHYICYLYFQGEALDSDNMNNTGDLIDYNIFVFDIGNDQFGITYSFKDGFGSAPIMYNSPLVLNLDILLENTKNEYYYGMAYNITEVFNSVIVSWD